MTEEEARTKWCPHVRGLSATGDGGVNRTLDGGRHRSANCIGSACMAWRWVPRYGENPNNPAEATSLPPTEGYCGLAGRPTP